MTAPDGLQIDDTVREEISTKAPLLDAESLVRFVIDELLTAETSDRADSLWLRGSLVDPEKPIDRKQKPSDVDVFVAISGWDLPIADPSIVLCSDDAPDPPTKDGETHRTDDYQMYNTEYWESAERAWERLPEFAQETLVNSTQNFVRFREDDARNNIVRNYDLRIGRREHVVKLYPSAKEVYEF